MYFWNYKMLAQALNQNDITKKNYQIYLVLFWINIIWLGFFLVKDILNARLSPFRILDIFILLLAIVLTYGINKSGDGKDYFKRLACLNLPISIRTFITGIIAASLLGSVYGVYGMIISAPSLPSKAIAENMVFLVIIVGIAMKIYYTILSAVGFKIASGQASVPPHAR